MLYLTYTDEQIKTELAQLQADLRSVITKWTAGDTSVEKEKMGVEKRLHLLNEEIRRRPSLAALIRRTPITRSVGRIVEF